MMKVSVIQFMTMSLVFLAVPVGYAKEESGKQDLIDFRDSSSIKDRQPVLIAHRGGVITSQSPECSIAAIRLAKQQGYAMVELDIRQSKDHVPIVFHDNDMKKACGINKRISDLNADEIVKMRYVNTDQMICTFDQALGVCRTQQLGLMLDVKVTADERFFNKIVTLIKKHGYENASITINGDPDLRSHLKDVALLTVTQDEFKKVQQGMPCDLRHRFWFGLPHRLPSEMVKALQQNGAYVIPAINTFRYPADGHYELARKDIQRLNEAGVDGYQIDSVYRPLFPGSVGKPDLASSGPFSTWLHPAVSTIKQTSPASPSLPGEKTARSRADDGVFRQSLEPAMPGLRATMSGNEIHPAMERYPPSFENGDERLQN